MNPIRVRAALESLARSANDLRASVSGRSIADEAAAKIAEIAYEASRQIRASQEIDLGGLQAEHVLAFMGFVSTCRRDNTPEWMLMLAKNLNTLARTLKLTQHWRVDTKTSEIWSESAAAQCDECGGSGACDSGGVRENGTAILVPCGKCSTKVATSWSRDYTPESGGCDGCDGGCEDCNGKPRSSTGCEPESGCCE